VVTVTIEHRLLSDCIYYAKGSRSLHRQWGSRAGPAKNQRQKFCKGFIDMTKVPSRRRGHSAEEAAEHLFVSLRRFFALVAEGVIRRAPPRGYNLDRVREAYFKHLRRGVAEREGADAGSSLVRERAALAREQRESLTLKNAISRGDFVPVGVVRTSLAGSFATLRSRALAICKIAPAIEFKNRDEVEAALRDEVHAALEDMCDPDAAAAKVAGKKASRADG
jgi:hypothetical protein